MIRSVGRFLRQVLLAKGFEGAYVHRVMQLVSGGHTAVSVNGQVSNFFANGQGLRQGDPASSIMFNFVADALSCILSRAASHGHISPVISHLILEGVTHLQYADDTIIMVELNDSRIAHLKFILLCFEGLSGLKIKLPRLRSLSLVLMTRRPYGWPGFSTIAWEPFLSNTWASRSPRIICMPKSFPLPW